MEIISFSKNWNNKLNCDCFTTIRLSSLKYIEGHIYECVLVKKNGENVTIETKGIFKLESKKTIKLNQINNTMARLDTGYDIIETINIFKKMYKDKNIDWANQKLDYLLLVKHK